VWIAAIILATHLSRLILGFNVRELYNVVGMYPSNMMYHPSLFCCWTKLCRDVACWCGSGGGWSCEMEAMPDVIALIVEGKNLDLMSDFRSDVNASVLINFEFVL